MLTKITNERAARLGKGDHVVSPFSSPPFAPLAPALHVHAVIRALPATELDISGQLAHVPELFAPSVPE